jgi:hypothetical protein
MSISVIHDRFGAARLRILENGNVTNFVGQHVGFIKNDCVYNYTGLQVGWYEGGILRDLNGNTVGFNDTPTDNPRPLLPLRQLSPHASLNQLAPLKPLTELRHLKPLKSFGWSHLEPEQLFFSKGHYG